LIFAIWNLKLDQGKGDFVCFAPSLQYSIIIQSQYNYSKTTLENWLNYKPFEGL